MLKLKWFGLRPQVLCDRCTSVATADYLTVCMRCFRIPAESVRRRDLRFADAPHNICAMCAGECYPKDAKQVCQACTSKHPDLTHSDFGRSESAIFSTAGGAAA